MEPLIGALVVFYFGAMTAIVIAVIKDGQL